MGAEFVVDAALRSNPKFRDLQKKLAGPANAAWALIRLWSWAAANRPDGDLTGIDPAEIPLTETEWRALHESRGPKSVTGFLEIAGDVVTLHDFEKSSKHQTAAERRRQAARIAGLASAASRQEAEDHGFIAGRAHLFVKADQAGANGDGEVVSTASVSVVNKATEKWLDDGFEWFYAMYPKHEGRFMARRAWGKLHRVLLVSEGNHGLTTALRKRMAEFVTRKIKSGEWEMSPDRKQYVPAPAVFLNQRRWEE